MADDSTHAPRGIDDPSARRSGISESPGFESWSGHDFVPFFFLFLEFFLAVGSLTKLEDQVVSSFRLAMSPSSNKTGIRKSRHGGLKQLEHILRILDGKLLPATQDAIFVSIDLEVSRGERAAMQQSAKYIPRIEELGVAVLDSRDILYEKREMPSPPNASSRGIRTQQFSTSQTSRDFEDCDVTDFRECAFAETFGLAESDISSVIRQSLQVKDEHATNPESLRGIAIVGHSPCYDLRILERMGLDFASIAPIVAVIDTHTLSRHILGSHLPAGRGFSLCAVLTTLGCPFQRRELHNAGNDATYTMHAMMMLALKWAEAKHLTKDQSVNVERLRAFAKAELHGDGRWKPVRQSLGARVISDPGGADETERVNCLAPLLDHEIEESLEDC